jgi:hypothetical protein
MQNDRLNTQAATIPHLEGNDLFANELQFYPFKMKSTEEIFRREK